MKTHKCFILVVTACWLTQVGAGPAGADKPSGTLQVYLPRTVTLEQSTLCLGNVSVLRGDPDLCETAGKIKLGRIIVPTQRVVVNRNTVLSRLATHGISGAQVKLSGAKQVVIQRASQTIQGADLLDLAQAYLHKHYNCPSAFVATPLRKAQDVIIEEQTADIQLVPRLVRGNSPGLVKVQITVRGGVKALARQDIQFRLQYQSYLAIATQDIARGTAISRDNVKIEKQLSPKPPAGPWKAPWGLIAQRPIRANSKIQGNMLSAPVAPLSIKRNDMVVIRIERPGLVITAMGQAQANARSGDILKVKNTDSQRIILCKVGDDGTVNPVF